MTTDEKTTTNFLGIPVHGDITKGDKRVPQRPLEDLEPIIRAVLDDPYIHSFGWTQYTPYFNDGDPCVFSVGTPWFRTVDDTEPRVEGDFDRDEDDEGYDDDFKVSNSRLEINDWGDGHPSLGKRDYEWVGDWATGDRHKVYGPYRGSREATYNACFALTEAIDSEAFEDVLLEAFGDHCQVTIKATGITVDEYSHD